MQGLGADEVQNVEVRLDGPPLYLVSLSEVSAAKVVGEVVIYGEKSIFNLDVFVVNLGDAISLLLSVTSLPV